MYYSDVVSPILGSTFPGLRYSAGLTGSGSDVIGYDTQRSTDHGWGPRLYLFLSERDYKNLGSKVDTVLRKRLPRSFMGYSTNFTADGELKSFVNTNAMEPAMGKEINHGIRLYTARGFFNEYISFDISRRMRSTDWLFFTQQKLLTIQRSKIFHDDLGIRREFARFSYYPRDIWLYMLSAQWLRIGQEEPYMARASAAGDELGSRIIAARTVNRLMELCFLMEKRYAPYSKWFGTAFSELRIARRLKPALAGVLGAKSVAEREMWLSKSYAMVASAHNSMHITEPMPTKVSRFHSRPYLIIHGDIFSAAIRARIRDSRIRNLPVIGSVDQFLSDPDPDRVDYAEVLKMLKSDSV